ncbi:MAG: zinc ribbon domain-containing protein [Nanoarchaeota archaeon]|nr:zinc ribbon domain-containing protein [Nanoarchaeota archaeon]
MPTYTYRCRQCKHLSEIFCSYSEKHEVEKTLSCEHCNAKEMMPVFKVNIGNKGNDSPGGSCGGSCGGCSGCG